MSTPCSGRLGSSIFCSATSVTIFKKIWISIYYNNFILPNVHHAGFYHPHHAENSILRSQRANATRNRATTDFFAKLGGGAHPGIRRREGVRLPRFRCAPSMLLRFATEHCPLTAAGGKPLQPDTLPPPEMNVSISPESHRHRRPEPRTGVPRGRSARENRGRLSAGVSCPRERRSQPHISL